RSGWTSQPGRPRVRVRWLITTLPLVPGKLARGEVSECWQWHVAPVRLAALWKILSGRKDRHEIATSPLRSTVNRTPRPLFELAKSKPY
ncbi:MAG TPA: hypothetical protein PLY87_26600, partial [Planctomycetaceae bacterium]|nr:hypothetical protein [Planctomycetaceae bacterium]